MPYLGTSPASELANLDINGQKFILDADADTSITVDTDDQIDIEVGGTDVVTLINSSFVLKGTTPTLTIGDAGAEDTKIVFDGNAQDFHVGLDDTDDDLVIGKGSALGTTTALSIDENLLVTTHGGITMAGTTPTLTIGDAGAEDAKIVFDGNAQDFHIGLDDTDDDLKIGLGSTLGTTAHMVFTEAGEITKPLQPCFQAKPSSNQENIASDGSAVTVVVGTEIFDQGGDFSSNTFTAPVTGKYQLNIMVTMRTIDYDTSYYQIRVVTSNGNYFCGMDSGGMERDFDVWCFTTSVVADMDANDTAYVRWNYSSGSQQADVNAGEFSGYLVA